MNLTPVLVRCRRLAGVAVLIAFALVLGACRGGADVDWHLTNITGHLPRLDFQLTGDSGAELTGADLRGKVVMMYFGYTHCPDVCPLTLSNLHVVMQRLGERADEARIVFVSVDPQRDTPQIMHQYVRAFDPRAVGLTGEMKKIRKLTKAYRVVFDADPPDASGRYEVGHSSAVFIFDRDGRARLISTSTDDIVGITHDVRQLIEEKA